MGSKTENTILDANLMSNIICDEILKEQNYGQELGDILMVSATKNLQQIDAMHDFSINLLKQIAKNEFTTPEPAKTKVVSIEDKINAIQKEITFDISRPIHDMFEEMSGFVCDALAG